MQRGRFVHQIVVPFVRMREATRHQPPSGMATVGDAQRTFPPGSEWLYAKLYSGSSNTDRALRHVVRPVTEKALADGSIDGWFFLRYADPEGHLRLRLHGSPERLHAEVLPMLNEAVASLLTDGRLWRVQFDTYEREVERYGGSVGIVLAEKIFHADSETVLSIVETYSGNAGLDARWRLALRSIDMLMSDFGLDLAAKRSVIESMSAGFAEELRPDVTLRRQLGERYRRERRMLENLLDPAHDAASPLAPGVAALRWRSERIAPVVAELESSAAAGLLRATATDLLPSLTHMHVNRMLRSAQTTYEFILYDFLARFYESQDVRRKVMRPESK